MYLHAYKGIGLSV